MHPDQLPGELLVTLSQVAVLVIATAGLVIVFASHRLINLAHGEFMLTGSYLVFAASNLGLPLLVGTVLAFACLAVLGALLEVGILRRLQGRKIDSMLALWGVGFVLVETIAFFAGAQEVSVGNPFGVALIFGYGVPGYSLALIPVALIFLAVLYVVFKTPLGVQTLAASERSDIASTLGIDSDRLRTIAFSFGCGIAGAAGGMLAPLYTLTPALRSTFNIQTLPTALIAGPAILSGTALSATILGTVQSVFSLLFTTLDGQIALLVLAILLLRFFRTRLPAKRTPEL